jgi:hypothetical protein
MWRWFVSMMDVPEMLNMLDAHFKEKPLGRGGALIIFISCLLLFGPLCYLYWRFDLASTWDTFSWIASGGQPIAEANINDQNTAAFTVMLLGLGATLFPSAIQFGLARFISIPALGILIKVSIAFDLGTDLPTMWSAMQGWAWFDTMFSWAPAAALARFVATLALTAVASVVLQSVVILILSIGFYTLMIILMGGAPGRRRAALEG